MQIPPSTLPSARVVATVRHKQLPSVLASDGKPRLPLITCYPFYFTSDAPKRYIVEAQMVN